MKNEHKESARRALDGLRELNRKLAVSGGDRPKGEPYIDAEIAHVEADDILMNLLREIGMGDVADEFDKIEKWYA